MNRTILLMVLSDFVTVSSARDLDYLWWFLPGRLDVIQVRQPIGRGASSFKRTGIAVHCLGFVGFMPILERDSVVFGRLADLGFRLLAIGCG
jgi:hypothetical protein